MSRLVPYEVGELALQPGEEFIRQDVVGFFLASLTDIYPYPMKKTNTSFGQMTIAQMLITSERIIVAPPHGCPSWYRFAPLVLFATVGMVRRFPPLRTPQDIRLVDITRLWKWQPAFSGPPLLEANGESYQFRVLRDEAPWNAYSTKEQMREHFEVIEAAWAAARERAAHENT